MQLESSTRNALFTIGYVAKGIVYFLIGGFAVASVIGASQGTEGPRGVVEWIGTHPFGRVLLFLIGLGLLAYSGWRWYSALKDPEDEGHDARGGTKRVAWVVSGISYALLSIFAFKQAFGGGGSSGGGKKEDAIQLLLSQSWGQIAVGILALITFGVAAYQVYQAAKDAHVEDLDRMGLSADKQKAIKKTGEIGLVARGVVFAIIAYFLSRAALMDDPGQFRGIEAALAALGNQSMGTALLAIVGAGLLAYGCFMFMKARYETA